MEEGSKKCFANNLKSFHMLLYHIRVHIPVAQGLVNDRARG